MSILEIYEFSEAKKKRKRVGRGIASGKGKTCGRGHKGQKSRSGVAIKGFEGGQMPIHRRVPKRGFTNIFCDKVETVGLDQIQEKYSKKLIEDDTVVNEEVLFNIGLVNSINARIKILSGTKYNIKLKFNSLSFSAKALDMIKGHGGEVLDS